MPRSPKRRPRAGCRSPIRCKRVDRVRRGELDPAVGVDHDHAVADLRRLLGAASSSGNGNAVRGHHVGKTFEDIQIGPLEHAASGPEWRQRRPAAAPPRCARRSARGCSPPAPARPGPGGGCSPRTIPPECRHFGHERPLRLVDDLARPGPDPPAWAGCSAASARARRVRRVSAPAPAGRPRPAEQPPACRVLGWTGTRSSRSENERSASTLQLPSSRWRWPSSSRSRSVWLCASSAGVGISVASWRRRRVGGDAARHRAGGPGTPAGPRRRPARARPAGRRPGRPRARAVRVGRGRERARRGHEARQQARRPGTARRPACASPPRTPRPPCPTRPRPRRCAPRTRRARRRTGPATLIRSGWASTSQVPDAASSSMAVGVGRPAARRRRAPPTRRPDSGSSSSSNSQAPSQCTEPSRTSKG